MICKRLFLLAGSQMSEALSKLCKVMDSSFGPDISRRNLGLADSAGWMAQLN